MVFTMNNNVRKITDGAMMCAIVGLLLVVNRQLGGFFEELLLYAFPLPMVFYSAKYGLKNSLVVLFAMILLTVVLGTPQTLFFVASESILGTVYGAGIRKKVDSHKLMLVAMFVSVLVNLISTVIYASFFGYDMAREIARLKAAVTSVTEQSGVSLPVGNSLDQFLTTTLIVSVMLTGVLQGYITHKLSYILLKRMRYDIPTAKPISQYYPPIISGYLGIFGLVMYYYTLYHPFPNQILQNTCQGLGMFGLFYLLMYGAIALLIIRARGRKRIGFLFVLFVFIMTFTLPLPMTIIGFLYITTGWHQKIVGGEPHAA